VFPVRYELNLCMDSRLQRELAALGTGMYRERDRERLRVTGPDSNLGDEGSIPHG
jgi:hypothetical protein